MVLFTYGINHEYDDDVWLLKREWQVKLQQRRRMNEVWGRSSTVHIYVGGARKENAAALYYIWRESRKIFQLSKQNAKIEPNAARGRKILPALWVPLYMGENIRASSVCTTSDIRGAMAEIKMKKNWKTEVFCTHTQAVAVAQNCIWKARPQVKGSPSERANGISSMSLHPAKAQANWAAFYILEYVLYRCTRYVR